MRLLESCQPIFARHETFHPRYGWARKSVDAGGAPGSLFLNEEKAVVFLGVGKNMVQSIRFWGQAYKLLVSVKVPGERMPSILPTRCGSFLFNADGADPFSEDQGTPWLLHWRLLAPPSMVPVWWLAFNEFSAVEFSEDELLLFCVDRASDMEPSQSAIKKDVSCLLRMYTGGATSRMSFDDRIDCPSRELGILGAGSEAGSFRFKIGAKPALPPSILLYSCLDYLARTDVSARTTNVSRFIVEPGSPGRAFKLDDDALIDLLERATATAGGVILTTTAGVPQLILEDDATILGTRILLDHFGQPRAKVDRLHLLCGPEGDEASERHSERLFERVQ